ncbi:DNA replication protein [Pilibacter termitis]|uniref:DNA replication protein n=1 Tax=Pilibacter termitis TaxID=263852 RepID=A0A1T4MB46_9ENTE|nr:DnaD domain protein [Pilibacter termitis]SJZ64270.1 DNA replication protein [Pilibacter termitis]
MNLTSYLQYGATSISNVLFDEGYKLTLTSDEILFVFYLLREQQDGNFMPDLSEIAKKMSKDDKAVGAILNSLYLKKMLTLSKKKLANGEEMESFDITPLYEKLSVLLESSKKETLGLKEIKEKFEESFARLLNPFELETIQEWVEVDKFDQEVILLALKEAVLHNAKNMSYIERILVNWSTKGLTSKEMVLQDQKEWKLKQRQLEAQREFGGK